MPCRKSLQSPGNLFVSWVDESGNRILMSCSRLFSPRFVFRVTSMCLMKMAGKTWLYKEAFSTSHWWCDAHNLTPKKHFCVYTPHFLKHLLRLELLLTCAALPAQPAVALFHSFRPQNHNSSLCFEMPFRRSVNPGSLLESLRASLTLLTLLLPSSTTTLVFNVYYCCIFQSKKIAIPKYKRQIT